MKKFMSVSLAALLAACGSSGDSVVTDPVVDTIRDISEGVSSEDTVELSDGPTVSDDEENPVPVQVSDKLALAVVPGATSAETAFVLASDSSVALSIDQDDDGNIVAVDVSSMITVNGNEDVQNIVFLQNASQESGHESVDIVRLFDDANSSGLGEIGFLTKTEDGTYSAVFRLDANNSDSADPALRQNLAIIGVNDAPIFDAPTGSATFEGTVHALIEQVGVQEDSQIIFGDATANIVLGDGGTQSGSLSIDFETGVDPATGVPTEIGNIVFDLPEGFTAGANETITSSNITLNGQTYTDLEALDFDGLLTGENANEAAVRLQALGSNSTDDVLDEIYIIGAGVVVSD